MIYEVRTYQFKPGAAPGFIKAFGEAIEYRKNFSPLSAFFYTEIGPLNQVVHIWPYENAAERDRIRAEVGAADSTKWPPKMPEWPIHMRSEVFMPFPSNNEFASGSIGPIFEWRSYTIAPGLMPGLIEGWEAAIEERTKLSPLVMAMHTDHGELNKFVHIWAYESFAQREEVRTESKKTGEWPPAGMPQGAIIEQENQILLAAPFSLVR